MHIPQLLPKIQRLVGIPSFRRMSLFHLFSQLPAELRILIWSFAAHPRRVRIFNRHSQSFGNNFAELVRTETPPPAVIQVCRDARRHAPYTRAFTCELQPGARFAGPHYIWLNFATDTICLDSDYEGDCDPEREELSMLDPHTAEIQRLEFTLMSSGANALHNWCRDRCARFTALTEVRVGYEVFSDAEPGSSWEREDSNVLDWTYHFSEEFQQCSRDNVRFVDVRSGLVLTSRELKAIRAEKHEQDVADTP